MHHLAFLVAAAILWAGTTVACAEVFDVTSKGKDAATAEQNAKVAGVRQCLLRLVPRDWQLAQSALIRQTFILHSPDYVSSVQVLETRTENRLVVLRANVDVDSAKVRGALLACAAELAPAVAQAETVALPLTPTPTAPPPAGVPTGPHSQPATTPQASPVPLQPPAARPTPAELAAKHKVAPDKTPLNAKDFLALFDGRASAGRRLDAISRTTDVNVRDFRGSSALTMLLQSCPDKSEELLPVMRALLAAGADPNILDDEGDTPLHRMGHCKKTEYHRAFIEEAAPNLNIRNRKGETALFRLFSSLQTNTSLIDCLKAYLVAGADVNAANSSGDTPLLCATGFVPPDVIRLLLDAGANPHLQNNAGTTVLMKLIPSRRGLNDADKTSLFNLFLTLKVDVNAQNTKGQTVLWHIDDNDLEVWLPRLLKAGLDINHADAEGNTNLLTACATQQNARISLLVANGADCPVQNAAGQGAVQLYVKRFSKYTPEVLKLLLDHKATPNGTNSQGRTPVIELVSSGKVEVIPALKLLLAAGADINARTADYRKESALMLVDTPELARFLLDNGADPNLADAKFDTPLHHFANCRRLKKKKCEVLEMLLKAGAKPQANKRGEYPVDCLDTNECPAMRSKLDGGSKLF